MNQFLETLRNYLAEHVGKADLRLFDVFSGLADPEALAGANTLSADMAAVLGTLATTEKREIGVDGALARMERLNTALAEIGNGYTGANGDFAILRRDEARLILELHPDARGSVERSATRRIVGEAARADTVLSESQIVEPRIAPPLHQVFVSYETDDGEAEAVLDKFIEKLRSRLSQLPQRFRGSFAVRLWTARQDLHARDLPARQAEQARSRAAFAILMASDPWFASEACAKDHRYFEDQAFPDGSRAYVLIQLSGDPSTHDEHLRDYPCLPGQWSNKRFGTLLQLWSKGDPDDRDQFVTYVRDQICEHLACHGGPNLTEAEVAPERKPDTRLREIYSASNGVLRDLAEEAAIETEFRADTADADELDAAAESIPALPYLEEWATSPEAEQRILAIVGGFGMGKTVTVQRLADRLFQREDWPTPLYLDFRRLVPVSEQGKPVRADLGGTLINPLGFLLAV